MLPLLAAMVALSGEPEVMDSCDPSYISGGPSVWDDSCDPSSTSTMPIAQVPGDLSWGQSATGFQMALSVDRQTGNIVFFIRNATDKPLGYEQGALRYWENHRLEYLSGNDWVPLLHGLDGRLSFANATMQPPHAVLAPGQVIRQETEMNVGNFLWPTSVLDQPTITFRFGQEMASQEGVATGRLYSAPVTLPSDRIRVLADRFAAWRKESHDLGDVDITFPKPLSHRFQPNFCPKPRQASLMFPVGTMHARMGHSRPSPWETSAASTSLGLILNIFTPNPTFAGD